MALRNIKRITAGDILKIYRNNSMLTRLHVWVRFKTCPFLSIEEFIPQKGMIIDYGCGHGVFSHILSIMSPERDVYGIDMSKEKIEEAKKSEEKNSRVSFSNDSNSDNLIKQADAIAIVDVLCYFSDADRKKAIKRFYEILKKDAVLVIKDIDSSFSLKYFWLYVQEFLAVKICGITKARLLNFFKAKNFVMFLEEVGFKVQIVDLSRHYLYPHVAFVCRK